MKKEYVYGSIASLLLLSAYFLIVSLVQGFTHALTTFLTLWYAMLPLIAGFGIQVGLYIHIKRLHAQHATTTMLASGSVSTGSMIACCAHHLADILPLLGLSALALFLSQYQLPLILIGVFSNLLGIHFLLGKIQSMTTHALRKQHTQRIELYRGASLTGAIITLGIILLAVSFTFFSPSLPQAIAAPSTPTLASQSNTESSVTITVTPQQLRVGTPAIFTIKLETHQGDLDFDLRTITRLEDANGRVYSPTQWEGSPPGGHHRSGALTFPPLEQTSTIKLIIRNVYNVPERAFQWTVT